MLTTLRHAGGVADDNCIEPSSDDSVVRAAFIELAAIAQTGLAYSPNDFDRARYEQVAEVAERLRAIVTAGPLASLTRLVDPDAGHATPKVDVRSAVFDDDGRLLFVQERSDGLWTMPGGWCDPLEPPVASALREVWEEAGVRARVVRLAAVLDRDVRGHLPRLPVTVYKLFFVCEPVGDVSHAAGAGHLGGTRDAKEILDVRWFAPGDIPQLSPSRTSAEEIAICVRARENPQLGAVVD